MSNADLDPRIGLPILIALGRLNKHVYGGTVSDDVVAERRRRNRVARKSRRINRQRSN